MQNAPSTSPVPSAPAVVAAEVNRHVLFPAIYLWLVFFAAMDVMVTRIVLAFGGREANSIAAHVIEHGDVAGMIILKFAIIALVVCVCEYIGRQRERTAQWLAQGAVMLNVFPVVLGIGQLIAHVHW